MNIESFIYFESIYGGIKSKDRENIQVVQAVLLWLGKYPGDRNKVKQLFSLNIYCSA